MSTGNSRRRLRDARSPRTSPADFHEGAEASGRFRAAMGHLAAVPPSAVPRFPTAAKQAQKKK